MAQTAHLHNRRREDLQGGVVRLNSDTAPLSPRQSEVLEYTVTGLTADEIAQQLKLSTRTVVCHIQESMCKLGAINKTHLVALAFARGILIVKQTGSASVRLLATVFIASALYMSTIGHYLVQDDIELMRRRGGGRITRVRVLRKEG